MSSKGKVLRLYFEGAYQRSQVYVNGLYIGGHYSGYTSFSLRIDNATNNPGLLNYGGTNLLSVFVDANAPEGWWYDGGGIYRHVWLIETPEVHIRPWGVFALPSVQAGIQHGDNWTDRAEASLAVQTEVTTGYAGRWRML